MNCTSCGREILNPGQEFCEGCGARITYQAPQTPQPENVTYAQPASAAPPIKNTKQIVLSIISIVLCGCTGVVLGVIGLIFAITAKNEPTIEAQQKKLKTSSTLSIIGMVTGAIFGLIYVGLMIAGVLAGNL
jgi:uncharacterized membrane protein